MVPVPEGTKVYAILSQKSNGQSEISNWEILEQLISQLPKSKPERVVNVLNASFEEISQMYPAASDNLIIVKQYILKQLLGIELTEAGFQQNGKTRLEDETFEKLKKA